MKNLKNNIWIEGFDHVPMLTANFDPNRLYVGKTSEVPYLIANKCVKFYSNTTFYYDYRDKSYERFKTAKESIQSACKKLYCIIFKK